MEKQQLFEEIKQILAVYISDKDTINNISPENNLVNDLKIDSADLIGIVLDIEAKYSITIADDVIPKIRTVEGIIKVVNEQIMDNVPGK